MEETFVENLNPSLLNDGSFSSFIESVDSSLLENERFIEALNSIDTSLLTDGRFTQYLSSVGPQILLDGSFVNFTSALDRGLFSDGSFNTFLNTVDKEALTDGGFTETLATLGEDVLSSGNFTEAIVAINNIDEIERKEGVEAEDGILILEDASFQSVLRQIDPQLLTDGTFKSVFVDDFLIDFINSFDINDDGAPTLNGEVVSADEAEVLALDVLSPLGDIDYGNFVVATEADVLVEGGTIFQSGENGQINSTTSFETPNMTASLDPAVQDFASMENSSLQLPSDELGLRNTTGASSGNVMSEEAFSFVSTNVLTDDTRSLVATDLE